MAGCPTTAELKATPCSRHKCVDGWQVRATKHTALATYAPRLLLLVRLPPLLPSHLDQDAPGGTPRGKAPGLDRRLQLRLKRGQLPIEGRLDLHGLGREKARAALNAFVARQAALGRRCVLVITGKGRPDWQRPVWGADAPEVGVIRRALPAWLRDNPNKDHVLAFTPAQPRDGGAGAWYVLLRRRKDGSGGSSG